VHELVESVMSHDPVATYDAAAIGSDKLRFFSNFFTMLPARESIEVRIE